MSPPVCDTVVALADDDEHGDRKLTLVGEWDDTDADDEPSEGDDTGADDEPGEHHAPPVGTYGRFLAKAYAFPLVSEAEEQELGRRCMRGDKAARGRLTEAYLRLAIKHAKHWHRLREDADLFDLVMWAYYGLIEATVHFDPARGRFSAYASLWIDKRCRDFLNHWKEQAENEQPPTSAEDDDDESAVDSFIARSDTAKQAIACITIRDAAKLDARTKYILLRHVKGATNDEIGAELRISATRVGQIIHAAKDAATATARQFTHAADDIDRAARAA